MTPKSTLFNPWRFSGDDIIYYLLASLCLLVSLWCFVAVFSLSCIPGEHFMIKVSYFNLDEIYCPDCGELLRSVPRCVCGHICRHDYCLFCGLEQ